MKDSDIPTVFVKVKINSISNVDVARGTFRCDFTLMLDWYDPSVAVHPNPSEKMMNEAKLFFNPVVLVDNSTEPELKEMPGGLGNRRGDFKGHVKRTAR
jgi:hypothetical protein